MTAPDPVMAAETCPCCGAPVSPLDLFFDQTTGLISYDGKIERFSPSRFRLLKKLIDRYPSVVTKDECLAALSVSDPHPKIVDVQVCTIRRQADRLGLIITTVWGTGYRLELSGQIRAEVLGTQRLVEGRRVRSAVEGGDISGVRMLRAQGYPLTDIARRLGLTFKAVMTAADIIEAEDTLRRDRTKAA